jgi:hypothetical protein
LFAALFVGSAIAGGLATYVPEARAEYYSGIICMNKVRTASFSSAGEMYENVSTTLYTDVQCPIPLDRTMSVINFNISIAVKNNTTTTCRGRAFNRNGSEVWVSQPTTHTGLSGYVDVAANNGPAGTLDYNYNVSCNVAPTHLIRRIQLE